MQRTEPRPESRPEPRPDAPPMAPSTVAASGLTPEQQAAVGFLRAFSLQGDRLGRAIVPELPQDLRTNVTVVTLVAIAQEGDLRPIDIARQLGYSSGGTTRVLDRLERFGLIRREFGANPDDRRSSRVTLTPDGYTLVRSIAEGVRANVALFEEVYAAIGALLDDARTGWARDVTGASSAERDN